jgi:hypothetical protein
MLTSGTTDAFCSLCELSIILETVTRVFVVIYFPPFTYGLPPCISCQLLEENL